MIHPVRHQRRRRGYTLLEGLFFAVGAPKVAEVNSAVGGIRVLAIDNSPAGIARMKKVRADYFPMMVKPHPLVVELRTRSTNTGEAELSHEITVKFDTDVLHRGVVFDDEGLFHVGFLALWFEKHPHETEVVVDEVLHRLNPLAGLC